MASSVNHTVRLPRCRSASLYSDQFVTRRFGRAMWWRRSALYLCGMTARSRASQQAASYAIPPIRATRCQAVDLRRLDAVGEVTADDPLPVQVAQEHAQRAAQPDHRGPPE